MPNTDWNVFFSPQNLDRPFSEGAYNEAKRRAAAMATMRVDAIAENYIKQYEAYSKTSAKTRTQAQRRQASRGHK